MFSERERERNLLVHKGRKEGCYAEEMMWEKKNIGERSEKLRKEKRRGFLTNWASNVFEMMGEHL